MIFATLCGTLWIATVGIIALMWKGTNVSKEVSLALAAQWGSLAVIAYRMHTERSTRREL